MKNKIGNIPDDLWIPVICGIFLLILIVGLFMMQWHYLEEGRKECEVQGKTWISMSSGKVTTTSCK